MRSPPTPPPPQNLERAQGQFFNHDCNAIFRNYCVPIARKTLQPGCTMRWQNLLIEKLLEYSEFSKVLTSAFSKNFTLQ